VWDERFLASPSELTPNALCGLVDVATRAGNSVQLQGWGYLPSRSQRAHAINIAGFESGKIPKILGVAFHWPASAPTLRRLCISQEALPTGWAMTCPWRLPIHIDTFYSRFAYDAENGQACEMPGGRPVP